MDLDEIKTRLRERVEDLCLHLFPMGKRHGAEWTIGDVAGNPSRKPTGIGSLGVHLHGEKQGVWADHATGETGTLLDLWAMHYGYHGTEGWAVKAGEECSDWLGTTFEKRGTPERKKRAQSPPQKPQPRPAPAPKPALPSYEEEWSKAVAQCSDAVLESLAHGRGYSVEFCHWLRDKRLVGLAKRPGWRDALALPVHDDKGVVIAAHIRCAQTHADGSPITPPPPKWQYLHNGDTSPGTRLLIIGDVKKASKLWVFESQWDAFAVIDRMGLHAAPEWPAIAILITRGASNARLLQPYAGEGKTLILWPQNDQPDPRTGKIPAEEWVKGILEVASGSMPIRRVNTPKEHEDPNAWLKACPLPDGDADSDATALAVTPQKLVAALSQAIPARPSKLPPLCDMAFAIRPENRSVEPDEVIKGVLHRGSKLIVGGTSKGRKSFSLIDLAVSVATGASWWGFPTVQGRVLYLNFEIQAPFFERRVHAIAEAKGIPIPPGHFQSITLRGMTESVENLADELIAFILDMEPFALIIMDPIYKLMSGRDENKAGDVTAMLAQLEKIAVQTGAAVAFGAHYSKGSQVAKESIDRIGGSGAFARDPDAIMTMTAHEQNDSFTVESTLRNFAPIDPIVVSWDFPLFHRDKTGLDPAALKMPKKANGTEYQPRSSGMPKVRANSRIEKALVMMATVWTQTPRADRMKDMVSKGASKMEIPPKTAENYFFSLQREQYIAKDESTGTWRTTEKGDAYLDGLDAQKPPPAQPPTTESES